MSLRVDGGSIVAGSTSVRKMFKLKGTGIGGKLAADITVRLHRNGDAAQTVLTSVSSPIALTDMTGLNDAFKEGALKNIPNTDTYYLDLPNAQLASGAVSLHFHAEATGVDAHDEEIMLVPPDSVEVIEAFPREVLIGPATNRFSMLLNNPEGTDPVSADIAAGTYDLDYLAPGASTATSIVVGAPCSKADGEIYITAVFDPAGNPAYDAGTVFITFYSQAVTQNGVTRVINPALGRKIEVNLINSDAVKNQNAALATMLRGTVTDVGGTLPPSTSQFYFTIDADCNITATDASLLVGKTIVFRKGSSRPGMSAVVSAYTWDAANSRGHFTVQNSYGSGSVMPYAPVNGDQFVEI